MLRSCCELLTTALVYTPLHLCCEMMAWSVAFLTLPIRLLAAPLLHPPQLRDLEELVAEMQIEMDRLVWENEQLEEKLQAARKDCKNIEEIFEEMEEEHEDALATIDLLEDQLQELKEENMRLSEHRGKALWDKKAHDHGEDSNARTIDANVGMTPWRSPSWESGKEEQVVAQHLFDLYSISSQGAAVSANAGLTMDHEVLKRGTAVAIHTSLFSLIMSLAVGAIVWKAEIPCSPLVAALFIVVSFSMRSVLRLCSAMYSHYKPGAASCAVALLSLNCFLLGTITPPVLPGLAWMLLPQAGRLVRTLLLWFGFSA